MIEINAHEKSEWARLAEWADIHDMPLLATKFKQASSIPDTRVTPHWFDEHQEIYRMWLVFGLKGYSEPQTGETQ